MLNQNIPLKRGAVEKGCEISVIVCKNEGDSMDAKMMFGAKHTKKIRFLEAEIPTP